MARHDRTTLPFSRIRAAPGSIRAAVAVLLVIAFTAVAFPAAAGASACTLGADLRSVRDRPPSPGDGVTAIVIDRGGLAADRIAGNGVRSRIRLPAAVTAVYDIARASDG